MSVACRQDYLTATLGRTKQNAASRACAATARHAVYIDAGRPWERRLATASVKQRRFLQKHLDIMKAYSGLLANTSFGEGYQTVNMLM